MEAAAPEQAEIPLEVLLCDTLFLAVGLSFFAFEIETDLKPRAENTLYL